MVNWLRNEFATKLGGNWGNLQFKIVYLDGRQYEQFESNGEDIDGSYFTSDQIYVYDVKYKIHSRTGWTQAISVVGFKPSHVINMNSY